MARTVVIASDISGVADATSLSFAFDGRSYEIDLTEKERADFEKVLKKYTDVARSVGARSAKKGKTVASRSYRAGAAAKDIRAWAIESGLEVPLRGRIPEAVVQQFEAAHA